MPKKMFLRKIWNQKDCYGWIWHLKGRRYQFQNSNDLGLLGEDWEGIEEYGKPETILRKISIGKGKAIYVLRNNYGYTEEDLRTSSTIPTIKALIKECHCEKLTPHEKMLAERYWEQF